MGDKDFRCSLIVPSIQEQSFSIEGSSFLIVGLFRVSLKKNAWRKGDFCVAFFFLRVK